MDTVTGTTIVNNYAGGVITGNAVHADGDAVDVDYLVNITNSGTIQATGIAAAGSLNEALAIGGGNVTNNVGGLIVSDQRAITVDNSNDGPAFGATSIDNYGTITGKNGEAIAINSTFNNTLTNRATGVINGSVSMGAGNDTVNLYAGSKLNGALDGGAGNDTIHLMGAGKGSLSNVSNVENLKVDGGTWAISGGQSYSGGTTVAAGATAQVSGALNGGVVNNGTVQVQNGSASFDGTFQNNGALVSDPATLAFNNLSVGSSGYIQASAGDVYKVGGDFTNFSSQGALWKTGSATLEFTGADGTSHVMDLVGVDMCKTPNPKDDFNWGALDLDSGNKVDLAGIGGGDALYLGDLLGADIVGNTITNIMGFDGLVVYYNAHDADNSYLGGLTYNLSGGGMLISSVPEPESWALMILGFGLMGVVLRRRRDVAATVTA
jgi:autotransporter-associated beta strand protein